MVKAILLIRTVSSQEYNVVEELEEINHKIENAKLSEINIVMGEYDISAILEANDVASIGHIVTSKIRNLEHVTKTATLLAIEH